MEPLGIAFRSPWLTGDHARCVLTCWVEYSSSRQEVGWQLVNCEKLLNELMGQTFFLLRCFGMFMMADRESRMSVASWSIRRLTLMPLRAGGFETFLVIRAKTIKRTNWRWISYYIMLDRKPSKNIQPLLVHWWQKQRLQDVCHAQVQLYQGAKNVICRATGVMIVSWEEFC